MGWFVGKIASPQCLLQLPPEGSHPVLIARRLLMLGSLLQGIPPFSIGKLAGLTADYHAIMFRAVHTATRHVTSDDELVGSLDGIECLMIESMYLNNAGNLRRAWITNRRAMVMAQMMGLHRGARSSSVILEPGTWDRIDPDYMWFRLVCTDRYLSLMLGLPQGSLENAFATHAALRSCAAVERMERMESVAAGLIIQRNSAERTDLAATYKIDRMLQEAAALMPPQWWLMAAGDTATASNDAKAFEESIRLMLQFTHRHLLVQLHLPYMMQSSITDTRYDYSKMTAANASRAIVAQFVAFRGTRPATAYCRGIDFIVFIASTTLCIAHIEARRQQQSTGLSKGLTVFQSLQHQRLSDRGLLERTLEIMESETLQSHDVIAQEISSILKPLLAVENNSAGGRLYQTSASLDESPGKQESRYLSSEGGDVDELRIHIPYYGTIKIEYNPTRPAAILEPVQVPTAEEWLRNASTSSGATDSSSLVGLCEPAVSPLNREQRQKEKGKETASAAPRPAGYEISAAQPVNPDWQAVPSYLDSPDPLQQPGSAGWDRSLSSFDVGGGQDDVNGLLVPGLGADVDDWALQGVDLALFSNIT
ncbi:hypothetical protein SLS62_009115 [Diatrype stigma]|uniref:Xylanolytic transcriptional activator regulatory domain-containing protein n=1 Tax=Diatrype stigma TaxID=117547 RepID=A0AAN9UQM7_9PEZI